MTAAGGTATVMLELVLSAMSRSVPPRLPLQRERGAGGPEVADVDALGRPDAQPALQRLVDMPEQRIPRLGRPDGGQQGLAPPLHPPGDGVEQQLGYLRRDVRAQDVDLPDRLDLGG